MCIVNFHYKDHPKYELIVISNRDEFYERPTAPAHFWEDHPYLLAGRDLEAMGTWLGITKNGRFATLTNIRDLSKPQKNYKTSRGEIVTNFLTSETSPEEYVEHLAKRSHLYDGFNIIVGDETGLYYLNNVENRPTKIEKGTHSLSNEFLNSKWPKVIKGRNNLRNYVTNNEKIEFEDLFSIGLDDEIAPDEQLPKTGVPLELERKLSSLFIRTENYGTRTITVFTIDYDKNVQFKEHTFTNGKFTSEISYSFSIK